MARGASIPDLGAGPPSKACPSPAVKFALTNATCAFDDCSWSRYHKLWRISVIPLVVGFLFRIDTRYPNAHGTWHRAAGRLRSQLHWQLPPLVSAVVLPIKSSRRICTRNSCVRNARNVASALCPPPDRSRKPLLFVMELLQSPENGHANERDPRQNRSRQRKIETIGDSGDAPSTPLRTGFTTTRDAATSLEPSYASLIHRKRLTMAQNRTAI